MLLRYTTYILPSNLTNTSCPSQPCATFSHYLQWNAHSLPMVLNVEYHFLPGEHTVTEMHIAHAHNFSLLGMVDNYFSQVVIKFYTDAVYFISCANVSIAKLVFEFCECSECNEDGPAIYVTSCIFCNIEHVTLSHFMLHITNMMGKSYMHHINIQ